MRERSVPALVTRDDINSTIALIRERAEAAPDHVAFHVSDNGRSEDLTLPQFFERVDHLASRLVAQGFAPGDHAAIIGHTCFEWSVAEFAIWRAGGIVVPIYDTTPLARARDILNDSAARVLFIGSEISPSFRDLDVDLGVWDLDAHSATDTTDDPSVLTDELDARCATIARTDIASIVYTSGTTGEQKGTRITHANFIDLVLNIQAAWKDVLNENGRTVIFLPLAHVLARGLQMICMRAGMRVTHMSDPKALITSLPDLQPTFLVVVPRVLEKILAAIASKANDKNMSALWNAAESTAREWGQALEEADMTGRAMHDVAGRALRIKHRVFDALFYRRVRSLLGGHIEFLLSGAAPLNPSYSFIFRGMGVPIMEGYGLTETTAPAAGNRPGRIRSGTVGEPVPGTTIRIDDDGHVLIKGIGVAAGYTSDDATSQVFRDGFFDTGDLGQLDDHGFLTITGRAKDILVTAGGKNVAPAKWEAQLEEDPLVAHAVMVGENRPYLSALILLDRFELEAWAKKHGETFASLVGRHTGDTAPTEVRNEAVLEHIRKLVAKANSTVARSETVKSIRALIVEATPESGLLTPTLKIKRNEAIARFSKIVDDLYERTHR